MHGQINEGLVHTVCFQDKFATEFRLQHENDAVCPLKFIDHLKRDSANHYSWSILTFNFYPPCREHTYPALWFSRWLTKIGHNLSGFQSILHLWSLSILSWNQLNLSSLEAISINHFGLILLVWMIFFLLSADSPRCCTKTRSWYNSKRDQHVSTTSSANWIWATIE